MIDNSKTRRTRALRRLAVLGAVLVVFFAASSARPAPPPLRVSDATAEATDSTGADATYNVKAFDPATDTPLAATCDNPPGTSGTGNFDVPGHFPIGVTTVTCQTTTLDSTTVTKSATITIQDTTPPTVSAPANISVSTSTPGGVVVTYPDASATDTVDGSLPAPCNPPSGSTFPAGTTTVTCTATDSHGNTGSASFTVTVTVTDTTPPVLTLPSDITTTTESAGGAVVTYSASATDNIDGSITPSCNPPSGSTFPVGTTTVTCTATDSHSNSSSGSFSVTVNLVDTTAPVLTVPSDMTVTTGNPGGAVVTYSASATDNVDGSITPSCSPASGATFPVGATTVTCTATDAHSNTASKSFTVTVVVVDNQAPVLSGVPASFGREANGPDGSRVSYTVPTAVDNIDGPLPVTCSPGSGALFPLGTTKVTCSATDSHGNTASASFNVSVVDTTPPRLLVPPDSFVNATSAAGIPVTDPAVQAFLAVATANDIVDPSPKITNDAPAVLPVGTTTITFTATDASGNKTTATAALTVKPPPPPGTPQPPPPVVDRTPPDDVTALKASVGNRLVKLTWKLPSAKDFDHVEIARSSAAPGSPQTVVYKGKGKTFSDRKVQNGVEYRYVLTSFDQTGNNSAGVAVTATPKRALLVSPQDAAKVKGPPTLAWVATATARYYNVQVFRGSQKILSAWPAKNALQLHKAWKFQGRQYRLTRGLYRWYVWPGIGRKSEAKYGPMLGTSTFQFVG
ncbi:MAG TPA: HYR domain-containing protein [Gaiellaceae bacterium]